MIEIAAKEVKKHIQVHHKLFNASTYHPKIDAIYMVFVF